MTPIGPVALGLLTVGAWLSLWALRAAHHRLNIRALIRQAEQAVLDAENGRP